MLNKRIIVAVGISIVGMLLMFNFMYDFELTGINVANVLFLMGSFYFFPGLVGVTGAGNAFNGMDFTAKKMFMGKKKAANYFKTFGDYMDHKNAKNANRRDEGKGYVIFIIGIVYILASIIIGIVI